MPRLYDLHTHSWVSDGVLSPSELVCAARGAGVDVLALTDHDDTAGVAEARAAGAEVGLQVVAGVEISVTWSRMTIHVVGLGVNPEQPDLSAGLARLRRFRDWRAEEMGRRLAKAGIEGALEGAKAHVRGRILSRTHFAQFLVEAGRAKDLRDVFRHYLKPNKPGYVPGQWATLDEVLGWIANAGGQAVLAHPARYRLTATKLRRLAGDFRECGGTAIEVVSGSQSPEDTGRLARLADAMGLMASVGSDYHGPQNRWIELGGVPPLPRGCVPIWRDWELSATSTGATV